MKQRNTHAQVQGYRCKDTVWEGHMNGGEGEGRCGRGREREHIKEAEETESENTVNLP